jgi:hypothetical protein
MKITVIVPTGETRAPGKGEYAFDNNRWIGATDYWYGAYPIGIAHEIEVPDTAHALSLHGQRSVADYFYIKDIPLPRPKKKVKKWRWVIKEHPENIYLVSIGLYTEKEIYNAYEEGYMVIDKIAETEIEVEE